MSLSALTMTELKSRIGRFPRVDLSHLPTPLEGIPRFAEKIGGVRILMKRDDCTGMLFGGNKTRHNEFVLADALQQGADSVVWGAGIQSNNCRQTAAACAKLGLECRLFLSRGHHGEEIQGNLLLDYLVGAKVQIVDTPIGPELEALLQVKAEETRGAGRRPYCWSRKRALPLAAVSYVMCLAEIVEELERLKIEPAAVYVSSAGSTGAGLALGKLLLGLKCRVRSICPIRWPWDTAADLADIANQAAALLDLPHRLKPDDVEISNDFIGEGYGAMTESGWEAIDLLARTEGILLDPVYTAKAMAGLIHDVRERRIGTGQVAVFVHTGGLPAVFAYHEDLISYQKSSIRT